MSVKILYFASLREAFGTSNETLALPPEINTVGALRDWLIGQGRTALGTAKNLRCAVNQDMAALDTGIKDGDEIAFFPPVTGG
ncbi:molybdopterin converting factor subunit 1 [Azonexus sp.]|uniref:molybdopterin converting factor subunit 1 n=1 Tax=Azonexus sp. TaxID=1872668 RepID=UPI0027BA971C|nr:molybdopterin converting factor subunit 1 [Azonexus sp.]